MAAIWLFWNAPVSSWPLPLRIYGSGCLAISLIALPAAAVQRRLRLNPRGVVVRSRDVDLRRSPEGVPRIGTGVRAMMLRLPGNESMRLRTYDYSVTVNGLPPELNGLSVLHLSDFHFTVAYQREFFEAVADEAARLPSDLVLFTGDLVDDEACVSWIEPVLGRLRGRLGCYAILGNHDRLAGPDRIEDALRDAGYQMLEGRWVQIADRTATLCLGGTSAPWGPDPDPKARPVADLTLLLCHTPDRLYRAASWGTDLMFSGHNHGGQVRLPLIGPILMPSRYSRRFDCGFFRHDQTLMYVSRGLGAEYPIRYGCRPEIARLTFRVPRLDREDRPPTLNGTQRTPLLTDTSPNPRPV